MNQLEKFDKLCTQIYYWKGAFRFPFEGITHDKKFETIYKSDDYPLLENKIKNLQKEVTGVDCE